MREDASEPATDGFLARRRDDLLDVRRALRLVFQALRRGLFPGAGWLPWFRDVPWGVRLRHLFEDLGLTYLKLGQFLAMRYDVLPPEVCRELARLFEEVSPLSGGEARKVVERELGGPIEDFFAGFEAEPLAAASVAQVHRASLFDGTEAAVKLQRPGLKPIFLADIRNLRRMARLADALRLLGRLSARSLVSEFARWTLRELDFRIEGRTADRLRHHAQPYEIVPRVFWDRTTERVLTLELIHGISVSRVRELLEEGGLERVRRELPDLDVDLMLGRLAQAYFAQIFEAGFFHGDPHPGNILVCSESRIAFIDFGIFGELGDEQLEAVVGQLEAIAVGDLRRSLRYYSRQLVATEETDPRAFWRECLRRLREWYQIAMDPENPIAERHLAKLTGDMIDISRRHGMRFGVNYLLFWRALNSLNATIWMVDPRFDMVGEMRRFFSRNQPGPVQRTFEVVRDPHWQRTLADLARSFAVRTEQTLSKLEAPRTGLTLLEWEPDERIARAGSEARSGALGLVALSLLVVAVRADLSPLVRTVSLIPAGGLAMAALWRWR